MQTTLNSPGHCKICKEIRVRHRARHVLAYSQTISIKTTCRICGWDQLLEFVTDYRLALQLAHGLDDQPMTCSGGHSEVGGWGTHWRFDEVFAAMFPGIHAHEEWPLPPWYENQHPGALLEGLPPIELFHKGGEADNAGEIRGRLIREVFRSKFSREELQDQYPDVYDPDEVVRHFRILGHRCPWAIVKRQADGLRGTMLYQNYPRFYFGFDTERII